jgi:hypothetical protein
LEPPSLAYSTSNRVTVQGDPGRTFRPDEGRNARGIFRLGHRTLRAARVGYYPAFDLTVSVRPSRASPARLPLLRPGCAGPTLSRCHRALHGPCCFLAALGHVPRQALRGWRCPPLHAVSRPQGSRGRCAPSRALLGRARRSAAWLVHRRSPHPRRFAARPCPRDRGSQCRRSFPASQSHEPRQQAVTVHAHALPRATVISNDNGRCTRSEDPALLTELAEKPSSAPAPLAVWLRHFNASLLLCPAAVPGGPDTGHASEAVMSCAQSPALSRLPCGTCTAPSVGAGWVPGQPLCGFRGVEHPASQAGTLDFFLSSTGSPQALSSSSKAGPPASSTCPP